MTFDDSASSTLGQATPSWGAAPNSSISAKPTNYNEIGPDTFPAPAPAASSNTTLAAAFAGDAPNGTWALYVIDDACPDGGSIDGWSLDITTASAVATSTSVGAGPNPSSTGQSVTFTATVTSSGSPVTTGTVTFSEGPTTYAANVALNVSGQASFSKSNLTEGNHIITATYNGTGSFATSSGTVNQRVDNVTTVNGNTYCNTGAIAIPATGNIGNGGPYPSNIFVTGAATNLANVTVALKSVSHTVQDDIEMLLVSPGGQNLTIVSDAGNGVAGVSNLNINLDDAAASTLPTGVSWGSNTTITVKPTNVVEAGADTFPAPAPAPSAATTLATFNGTNGNGTWRLYVVDDGAPDVGSVAGGWCLSLTAAMPTPTGVAATATSPTRISVTWNAVAGATSYEVARGTVSGGPYPAVHVETTNAYANNDRIPGTTYFYVVRAIGPAGTSANSAQVSATTPALAAAPANVMAAPVSSTRVQVSWDTVAGATGYEVYHSTLSGGPYQKKATVGANSFLHTTAVPGTVNYYVVRTLTATSLSADSAQASATTPPLPVAPANVVATAISSTKVGVSWNAVGTATAYEVWRSTISGGPYVKVKTVSTASATDTTVSPATTYYYVVRTVDPNGTSANSAQATVTTP